MRYGSVKLYLEAEIEFQSARLAGRSSNVTVVDLAKLGEIAFANTSKGDEMQSAVASVAHDTALAIRETLTPRSERASTTDELSDEDLVNRSVVEEHIVKALGPELSRALRGYAEAYGQAMVDREARRSESAEPALGEGDVPVRAYAGIWRDSRSYSRGLLATHGGATWVATRATGLKPGTDDSGWKMIAKGH